jgi:hypothetical protein
MSIMKKLFLPLVLLVTAAVYWPVVATGKLSDDFNLMRIRSITAVFTNQGGWSMRFLGNLTIYFDNCLYGENMAGFHVTNILLFCGGIILVWRIARALSADEPIAALSAAVYAFHFANAGSVSWLSDRWTLLSSVFILATIFLSIRYFNGTRPGYLAGALATYAAALLTKESGVTAMLISFAYVVIYRQDEDYRATLKRTLSYAIPVLLITLAYGVVRFAVFTGGAYPVYLGKLLLGPVFFASYAFIPFDYFEFLNILGIEPGTIRVLFAENGALRVGVALAALLLLAVCVFLVRKYRTFRLSRLEQFGLAWFVISIIPYMAWFEIRWLNPATAGVSLVYASLLSRLLPAGNAQGPDSKDSGGKRMRQLGVAVTGILALLLVSSACRVQSFRAADRLVRSIISDTKTIEPSLPSHSIIVMLNPPDMQRNVHIFRVGLLEALQDEYADTTLRVVWNLTLGAQTRPLDEKDQALYVASRKGECDEALRKGGTVVLLLYDARSKRVVRYLPPKES